MTFLSPVFLWLLPLAVIPIILHLLNKRPPKVVDFSHIQWIKDAHRKLMPKKTIKDLLLLIMRVSILLFLVLFFSRPVIRQGKLIGGRDDNSTLLLLMDVSASMGTVEEGRSALVRTVGNVKEMLREVPPQVRVGLLAYSDRIEQEFSPTTDRSRLLSLLDELTVMPRPTNPKPALDMAYVILSRQSKTKKSILLMTDNQETQWEQLTKEGAAIEQFDPSVSVIIWETGQETAHHGITYANLQLTEEGTLKGGWTLQQSPAANVGWSLNLNGQVVGEGTAKPAKPNELLPLQARLPKGGFYAGELNLVADASSFDNTYYLAGRIPKGFRVLIVEGESGLAPSDAESYYLKLAMESPRDPRLEQIRVVTNDRFFTEHLPLHDVLVLANVGDLKEKTAEIIAWVEKGGNLFLSAGSHWQDNTASALGLFRTRATVAATQNVTPPESSAALLSGVAGLESFEWKEIRVGKHVPVEVSDDLTTLISLTNSDPLLISKRRGRGSVVFLTTSIDRAWTNMPSKPVFSPLMRELISRLADPTGEEAVLQGVVDAPFEVRLPPGVQNVSIVGPDGSAVTGRVDAQGLLRLPPVNKPGLYKIRTNMQDGDLTLAVNMNRLAEEGSAKRISEGKLADIFPKAYLQVVPSQTKAEAFVARALEGVDATSKLLFFIILFLLIETVVAWPMKRAALACVLVFFTVLASAEQGNRFVYTQLKYNGNWDPYPTAHNGLFEMILNTTNIPLAKERRVVDLLNPNLFETTALVVKGNEKFSLSAREKTALKQFIDRGGFVFFDDTLGQSKGPFGESVRALLRELYPDRPLEKISSDHAVYRSFFLMRNVSGRRISEKFLEGLDIGGQGGGEERTAVIYSANDLLGAWVKDNFGQYVFSCEPGGEAQRWEAFKLMVNIVYFSITGTYKKDAIHQPFIERKLGF